MRKIIVPPVFAMALLIVIYFMQPSVFTSVGQLICGIFFSGDSADIGVSFARYMLYFKEKGREGQRSLAMIFSVVGYLPGTITVLVTKASSELCIVCRSGVSKQTINSAIRKLEKEGIVYLKSIGSKNKSVCPITFDLTLIILYGR